LEGCKVKIVLDDKKLFIIPNLNIVPAADAQSGVKSISKKESDKYE